MRRHGWAIGWLFVSGATIGTLLDALQVNSRVERYPAPALYGEVWWVPLLMGSAVVAIGYSQVLVDPLLGHRRSTRHLWLTLSEQGWLILAYLITVLSMGALATAGLLLLIYANFWLLAGSSWQNILFSIVTAITGSLIEMTLVASGAFSYTKPDLLGVPLWLPCLYAIASLAVGDLGRNLLAV